MEILLGNVAVKEGFYVDVDPRIGHDALLELCERDGVELNETVTAEEAARIGAEGLAGLGVTLEVLEDGRVVVEKPDARLAAELSGVVHYRGLPGRRITTIGPPNGLTRMQIFGVVTNVPKGAWYAHSWEEPAWVECDDPLMAELLAEHYGCPIGRPEDWPDTWDADAEPTPARGPGGIIATIVGGLLAMVMFAATRLQLRTDLGDDFQARAMGGDTIPTNTAARQPRGTATSAPTATSLTDTARTWNTDEWRGHIVAVGDTANPVYGVIASNTATVLTIDRWYDPADPDGAAATTPANADRYQILPGQAPAWWVGLTETSITPAVTDTSLSGELTADGFTRQVGTWAHTAGTSTYTLTNVYTATGTRTIRGACVSNTSRIVTGQMMVFETVMPNPPTLVSGDQLTTTYTITM